MPDYESDHEDRKILTFKVNFLCQKSSESFHFFFSLKNMKLGVQLLLMTLFEGLDLLKLGQNFKP